MEMTQELITTLFEYNNGHLLYREKTSKKTIVGKSAGTLDNRPSQGRVYLMIKRKRYLRSRLIFLYHHGWCPNKVDHKDRNRSNDRIENLRPASNSDNSRNTCSRKGSSSKYLGVNFHITRLKWQAQITEFGKAKYLGMFNTENEAGIAYNKAAIEIHGEFANLNIITND